jgi:hypothetical protein
MGDWPSVPWGVPIPEIMALVENGTADEGRLLDESGIARPFGWFSGMSIRAPLC